jgi:hypothetical protein
MIPFAVVASYFMLIWRRTNAFAEYMTLLRLDRFFAIVEYNQIHKDGYDGNYVDFLVEYYRDFFIVRLLSCPVCVSFWIGLANALACGSFDDFIVAPLTLFFYLLFNRML